MNQIYRNKFSVFLTSILFLILFSVQILFASAKQPLPKDITSLIPNKYASIESSDLSHTSDVFILINDFHYNYQAQTNIAHIIGDLCKNHDYKLVLTEGGAGNLNLSYLRALAPQEIRESVSQKYLKKGYISGEEYLDIAGRETFIIEGLEDKRLYLENVNAFFGSNEVKENLAPFLNKIDHVIDDLKVTLYPAEILEFEKVYTAYRDGIVSFFDYIHRLEQSAARAGITAKGTQQLAAFLDISRYFSSLDDSHIRAVIKKYIQDVKDRRHELDIKEDSWTVLVQYESLDALIARLGEVEAKSGLSLEGYPELVEYRDKDRTFKALDIAAIQDEAHTLKTSFYKALLKDPDQQKLYQLSEDIIIFKRLINLTLSRKEYEFYKANVASFQPSGWVTVLKAICDRQLYEGKVPSADFITFEMLDKIDNFYRQATRRDDFFIINTRNLLKKDDQSKAIIIVGGFHKDIFVDYFKREKLNYAVVSPKFDTHEATCNYLEVFKKKMTTAAQVAALERQYLDIQATKGTPVETALASELRDAAKVNHVVPPALKKAIADGRAFVIKDIQDVNLDRLFDLEPRQIAEALTDGLPGITDQILDDIARKLRGPPGEQLRLKLKTGFFAIQETVQEAIKAKEDQKVAKRYLIALDDPAAPNAFLPDPSVSEVLRAPSGLDLVYIGMKALEYSFLNSDNLYGLKRVLKSDAFGLNTPDYLPKGNELKYLKIFWRGVKAHVDGIPFRQYLFKKTSTNSESQFFVTEGPITIVENVDNPKDLQAINIARFPEMYRIQRLTARPRKEVSLLPFFADGVGSSIRWLHMIRGIKRKHPDAYYSIILFDIPQNREFTIKQLKGIVDEVIWVKPEEPLVTQQMNVSSHFRIKDAHRVIWELLIQSIIDKDPAINKAYAFEHFVKEYDFSRHHPTVPFDKATEYANAYFSINTPVEFPLTSSEQEAADKFYEKIKVDPEKDFVIAYNLRLDMSLTDPSRNTNLYDTLKFVQMLKEKVYAQTGRYPKIIFFGNSPLAFANQLLRELSEVEKSTTDELYLDRIRALTMELVKAAQELDEWFKSDRDLIDFTNIWKLTYNQFKQTYTIPEQAAILSRARFVTGTNSGALDVPLALGTPGVRLTEYHYLGYNEFLAKNLTINVRPVEEIKSSKPFISFVADRGVNTFLNFLASPAVKNDPETVSRAYDEMIEYLTNQRYAATVFNLYHVKKKNTLKGSVGSPLEAEDNTRYRPGRNLPLLVRALAREGVENLGFFLGMPDATALEWLHTGRMDFTFAPLERSYPSVSIPVFFGVHSFIEPPVKDYLIVLDPIDKVPYDREFTSDQGLVQYFRNAKYVLVWDKTMLKHLTDRLPELAQKTLLMDKIIAPSIPRLLLGIQRVRYDAMASQLIGILEHHATTVFSKLKDQSRKQNRERIEAAVYETGKEYQIRHLGDFSWGRDLAEKLDKYFHDRDDVQRLDDMNYIGLWLISQQGLLVDGVIPFTFRLSDFIELDDNHLKDLFGSNIFESEAVMYQAYRAITEYGADITPLAELLVFKAQIIRLLNTGGVKGVMSEAESYKYFIDKENRLLADFFREYHIVAKDITPDSDEIRIVPRVIVSPAHEVESSL